MEDPYVAELVYSLIEPGGTRTILFEPDTLEGKTDACAWSLDGKNFTLTVQPTRYFSTTEEARDALEPQLEALVTSWGLGKGAHLELEFRASDVVDRGNPDRAASRTGMVSVRASAALADTVAPMAPPEWQLRCGVPWIVREMLTQWGFYRQRSAGLLDRAYLCLTLLEQKYGQGSAPAMVKVPPGCTRKPGAKRRAAAHKLGVDVEVLCKLGDLTASDDPRWRRKAGGGGPSSLSDDDLRWIRAAVPRLIQRAWEIEAGRANLPLITVPDIP